MIERHERESKYWEWVAQQCWRENGKIADNIYKREEIIGRLLLACTWIDQSVLEIGVGIGTCAHAIQVGILGKWRYTGTDMSPRFVAMAQEHFHLNVVRADVTRLPGEDAQFTRVMCLDSLEHVHPDDRAAGYAEIARVTAQSGLLLINMPLSTVQFHDPDFDHPFGLDDLHRIEKSGFRTLSFNRHTARGAQPGAQARSAGFVVMERN